LQSWLAWFVPDEWSSSTMILIYFKMNIVLFVEYMRSQFSRVGLPTHQRRIQNWVKHELHRLLASSSFLLFHRVSFSIATCHCKKLCPPPRCDTSGELFTSQAYAVHYTVFSSRLIKPTDEYIVFVTPTSLQLSIFSKILHPDKLDDLAQSSTAESLALINMLTKVSNSPILLKATADKAKVGVNNHGNTLQKASLDDALKLLPERVQVDDVSLSGEWTLITDWHSQINISYVR
jgi:hypothetical protein